MYIFQPINIIKDLPEMNNAKVELQIEFEQ